MAAPSHNPMQQRAIWHDYRSRCIYMITLQKAPVAPALSIVKETPNGSVVAEPTEAGLAVRRFVCFMDYFHPALQTWKYAIMPDHIHLLLFVKEELPLRLEDYIAALVREANALWGSPLLDFAFHDRIVCSQGMVPRLKAYILDNPRRYLLKMRYPDMLSARHRIRIGETWLEAVGNIMLLLEVGIEPVRVSSRFTPEELRNRKRAWLEAIRSGGVLASPFVSEPERRVRDYAIANGGRLVVFVENGFPPRFKPPTPFFDLCAEGRGLIVAPLEYSTQRPAFTRARALELNALAETLASEGAEILS